MLDLIRRFMGLTFALLFFMWIATHPQAVSSIIRSLSSAYNTGVANLRPRGG